MGLFQLVIKHTIGRNVDAPSEDGKTPLQCAIESNNLEAVNSLLFRGANKEQCDKLGNPMLFHAVYTRDPTMVETLLNAGFSPHARASTTKEIPLHAATRSGYVKIAQLLMDADSDPDCKSITGETPFEIAIRTQNNNLVQNMIDKGMCYEMLARHSDKIALDRIMGGSHPSSPTLPPPTTKVIFGQLAPDEPPNTAVGGGRTATVEQIKELQGKLTENSVGI